MLDAQIGLGVEGLAFAQEFGEASRGIGVLHEGPRRRVGGDPLEQQLRGGVQPNHNALAHVAPVLLAGHHAAAGGDDEGMPAGDLVEHRGFEGPEAGFAVAGKDLANRPLGHLFHGGVGIDEAIAQGLGQGLAQGAFARAHHPHQIEVQTFEPLGQGTIAGRGHGWGRQSGSFRF